MRRIVPSVVVLGLFAFLNAHNWCSPGWCASYGLPLKFYGWSDDIPTFNGQTTGLPGFSAPAFAVDMILALATTYAVYRKIRPRIVETPNVV